MTQSEGLADTANASNAADGKVEPSGNQFGLLKTRRFLPFFLTQFLGAFNDNVYKNTLILVIAFYMVADTGFSADVMINAAALLFILPYFIFSATAGQIADRYDKAWLIRRIKEFEILIMCLAAAAFLFNSLLGLYLLLFLMGTQSAFFGPVKYAILPQKLGAEELVGGNALVEMGTFVAIILGLVVANFLTAYENRDVLAAFAVVFFALMGRLVAGYIPATPAAGSGPPISWNILRQTKRVIGYATGDKTIFHSVLGISWFWFLGSVYLTQMPNYTRYHLHGSADVTTLILCVFSLGIGVGSLLCEKLSGRKVELGLVPFGAAGISIFSIDLYLALPLQSATSMLGIAEYLALDGAWRVVVDVFFIGAFGGFFIVPLYALVQSRTNVEYRAQVIAANNIINSAFMVMAAVISVVALEFAGLSIPQLFFLIALMNIAVVLFIFMRVPEFSMRFLIWVLSHTMYRVHHEELDNIPDTGAALIVCNHVSYVDALLLAGACRRPIRFIMFKPIYDLPVLNFIFRTGKAIPIVSQHVDRHAYAQAFDQIAEALESGDLLCIFPEGKLTQDGEMNEFKTGVERIVQRTPVPVIPVALRGLWGSFFSHKYGAMRSWPRRFWSRVSIVAGDHVPAAKVSATALYNDVLALRGDAR